VKAPVSDILYVTTSYPPAIGGAQIHLHRLAMAMQDLGHRARVITHWSSGPRSDWLLGTTICSGPATTYALDGVAVSQIAFPLATRFAMLPWTCLYYPAMAAAVANIAGLMGPSFRALVERPTVIHASRIGREFIVRAALDLAHRRGLPFVLTPNHHPRWKGYLYREYDKIYREADAVIALTSAERDTLVRDKGVSEHKVHVTGIGPVLADEYSVADFRVTSGVAGPFVLYLGQQYKYKGVGALVGAAPLVWKAHPDLRFVFAGPHTTYSRDLFRRSRDPRFVNLGPVDLRTKTAALAACELLCLPSEQESFGGVYVEAWSMRKPVIAGNIAPLACVVEDQRDGLLSSQNSEELARALLRLLRDPGAAAAMGQTGYEKVQQRYTWRQLAAQTSSIYDGLAR
jgi:glycosyltransferase involved in cell wall biosynthesis